MNMRSKEKSNEEMEKSMSPKRILSCDIGLKRIGIAIKIEGIILPLDAILRKSRIQASHELSAILQDRQIQTLIVGIPSQNQIMEKRIKHFVSLLEFQGEIFYVDEDLSSKIAQEKLLILNKKERKTKLKNGGLDSLAAVEILRRFIAQGLPSSIS